MQTETRLNADVQQGAMPWELTSTGTPGPMGYHDLNLFPGVNLVTLNLPRGESFSTDFSYQDNRFEFAFVLNGKARASLYDSSMDPFEVMPRSAIAHYLPDLQGKFEVAPGSSIQMLGLKVEKTILRQMLLGDEDGCARLIRTLETGSNAHFLEFMGMKPMQTAVVRQIFSCPYNGVPRSLFLQSKALELLSLQLAMFTGKPLLPRQEVLTADEEERIRNARDILKSEMAEAPSLLALSGRAGLSISKLKKGFKIVYGKTAYACLHQDRMERAHTLLSQRRMNVSQVAWEVGYINVGHFSTAFRRQFGVRPKEFQLAGI